MFSGVTPYEINFLPKPNQLSLQVCNLFATKNLPAALQAANDCAAYMNKLHVYFHYQGGALFNNKAVVELLLGLEQQSKKSLAHAVHLYHDIVPTVSLAKLLNPAANLLPATTPHNNLPIFAQVLDSKYQQIDTLFANQHFAKCLQILEQICQDCTHKHFHYHVEASKALFNRALCFAALGKVDVAIYNLSVALEFDANNPFNQNFLEFKNHLSIM